jgi:hypothetical protein
MMNGKFNCQDKNKIYLINYIVINPCIIIYMNIRDVLSESKIELDEIMNIKDLTSGGVQDKIKAIREIGVGGVITGIRKILKSILCISS